jgi:hypothetical protein
MMLPVRLLGQEGLPSIDGARMSMTAFESTDASCGTSRLFLCARCRGCSFVGVATGAKSTAPQDARGTPDERRDAPPADAIKRATAVV